MPPSPLTVDRHTTPGLDRDAFGHTRGGVLCVALDAKAAGIAVPIAVDLAHASAMRCTVLAAYPPLSGLANAALGISGTPVVDARELSRAQVTHLAGGRASLLTHIWLGHRSRALEVALAAAGEGTVSCALVAYGSRRRRRQAERIAAALEPHCPSVRTVDAAALSL